MLLRLCKCGNSRRNAALDAISVITIARDVPSYYYGKHPHQEVNLHVDASQYYI